STALENTDVIINLAGKNISSRRWSKGQKKAITNSRVASTELLCHALKRLKKPPHLIISASAMGFYGNRGLETIDEISKPGTGFLAEVCRQWEDATSSAKNMGIPIIYLRTGIVLGTKGGMLKKILPLFRFGLGSILGSGKQIISWISIDDLVRAIEHLILTPDLEGPFNMVGPDPVTNMDFSELLALKLHRPCSFSVPDWVIKLFLGRMGQEILLSSCQAYPNKLIESGYTFQTQHLDQAFDALFDKNKKLCQKK
ncbi:MAG: TIGR01777 family oxidoreductase, partial [bacterium]|nr:TIGR01777 family oxidoreductase [bacterium]